MVAEEGNVAIMCGLLSVEEMLEAIALRPDHVEMIITGRGADSRIIAAADLVTEMKEIKHYFHQGVAARVGIEK